MDMQTEQEREQQSLLVNDIRALVSQLNEKCLQAGKAGLQVELSTQLTYRIDRPCYAYPSVTVRVMAEIQ